MKEIHSIGQLSFGEVAVRAVSKAKPAVSADVVYKLFGKRLCALGDPIEGIPLAWPLQPSDEQATSFEEAGLTSREQEAVLILDTYFKPRSRFEMVDINSSLDRILSNWLEDSDVSAWKESKREDTVWKGKLATDTGSTDMF